MIKITDSLFFMFKNTPGNRFEIDGSFHTLVEAFTRDGRPLRSDKIYNAKFVDIENKNITARIQNQNGQNGSLVILGVE